jgi:TRAP-type C4-dicarboxylate transport system permease small subunit
MVESLSRMVHSIEKFIFPTCKITNVIGAVLLMAMMFMTTLDVILRSVFNITMLGTYSYEATGFMMITLVFLAVGSCQVKKGHVNIDLALNLFPKRSKSVINSFTLLVSLVFFAIFGWQSVVRALDLHNSGNISTALRIPTYPFLILIAIGIFLLCLVLLIDLIYAMTGGTRK